MGILKNLLKTANELYNASSNQQLGEYVGDKISNIVNKYDGTTEEEFEAQKEQMLEQIREELNSDIFDDEYCLALIDRWVDEYALSEYDQMLASFYKYRTWENVFYSAFEERRQKYQDLSDEEREALDEKVEEANAQCLKWIEAAIDHLDEENFDFWICALLTAKAERLHWIGGYNRKNEHVEAVRLAIQALPFACDENEKERAKASITGKVVRDVDFVVRMGGYGINGETPNALIQRRLGI